MSNPQSPRTAFIIAASSGIGLATATLFHSLGWNVAATVRTQSSAPSPLFELRREDSFLITRLDYEDLESIENAVKEAVEKFGKLDVVVCGGGYGQQGVFEAIEREKVKAQFDVNLFGIMDTIRAVLPHLRNNPGPSNIITISSGASFCGFPLASLYASSKFALEGFTESLSYELASQGISVKSVVPCSIVSGTGFASRTMGEAVFRKDAPGDAESEGVEEDVDIRTRGAYDGFVERIGERYGQMMVAESGRTEISAMDVARTIYEAATDGTDRLRYWVGSGNGGFIQARFKSKSDEEYMAFMRSFFK